MLLPFPEKLDETALGNRASRRGKQADEESKQVFPLFFFLLGGFHFFVYPCKNWILIKASIGPARRQESGRKRSLRVRVPAPVASAPQVSRMHMSVHPYIERRVTLKLYALYYLATNTQEPQNMYMKTNGADQIIKHSKLLNSSRIKEMIMTEN
jgi:hypothetical protein